MIMLWQSCEGDMVQSFLSGDNPEAHVLYSGKEKGEALKEAYKAEYGEVGGSTLHFIEQSETYLRQLSNKRKRQGFN